MLPRTWVPGIPRGYGDAGVAASWVESIRRALKEVVVSQADLGARYAITLEFLINPKSSHYRGQGLPQGLDLDNMVKQTIDALAQTRGGRLPEGLGILPNDSAIYKLNATKAHVAKDTECGVWITIETLEQR